ncbi:MAG TPA: alpha-L-rhamnosidase, partial [Planctomycetota bacterium]|nr:alpha-L-rhamnosidase [Planctomycetota bacterium]
MSVATRVFLKDDPFLARTLRQPYWQKGNWRCHWIGIEGGMPKPCVMAFRRQFRLEKSTTVRVHVSADERYALYLDGRRIGRGSERG